MIDIKVLGILGSPRKGGNTEKLLDEALMGAWDSGAEVEKISVGDMKIAPCDACDACLKTGRCTIQDDMLPIYDMLLDYDAIVLASPIFFYGLTAQVKALVDRCQALWHRKYTLRKRPKTKKGLFISTAGGQGEKVFEGAKLSVKYFFDTMGVVSFDSLLYTGTDPKRALIDFSYALNSAYDSGKNLVIGKQEKILKEAQR